jgi:hypothetical protein
LPPFRRGNEGSKFRVMAGMEYFRTRWIAAALVVLPLSAFAQGGNYDVKTMNFDLWCQEQQHLDPDRCDKRLPSDEKDFEAYRATIERYEIPYLQEKQNAVALDRNILNNDPVDNPISQDPQTQTLQQQRSQTIDPRTPQP